MPALKPAAPSQPSAAKSVDKPAETEQPDCVSERDIILRIVEAVKNL